MKRWTLSRRAVADLDSIWRYTADHWGLPQAETYITLIRQSVEAAAHDPRAGRSCDEIRRGYRKLIVGSHVIFYLEKSPGIHVVRILHQRMDFERRL